MPGQSLRGGDRGFPPDTMNVVPRYFQKNIEEINRTKRNLSLYDFPPTCCIYPATWDLGDNPALHSVMEFNVMLFQSAIPYRSTYICLSFRHLCTIFSILEEFISLQRKNSLIANCKCTHIYTRLYLPTFLHL